MIKLNETVKEIIELLSVILTGLGIAILLILFLSMIYPGIIAFLLERIP